MDMITLGAAIAIAKALPDTAAQRAEAAAEAAEEAAQSVDTATVAETKTYLGIS